MSSRVLCLMTEGFEEIELVTPVDLLRRAGVEVVLAAVGATGLAVTGRCGMTLKADCELAEVMEQSFDLLLIPGGPGVKGLRADGRAAALATDFVARGKLVAAICAGPMVLVDAGLLLGCRFTAHRSVWPDLPGVVEDEEVVVNGLLITSQGAGTALPFGLALVRGLMGKGVALEVAESIMA